MDWQLSDIVKTITNNILPSSLTACVVRIGWYSHSVDRQLFLCISVSCRVIPMDRHGFGYSWKNWFNNMNHVGKYKFNKKNLQVMCELKMAQHPIYKSEHWRRGPSLYYCQMMRSWLKSRILRAFKVTL